MPEKLKTMTPSACKICGGQLTGFINNIFDDRHGYPGRFDIYRCAACGFGQTVPEIPVDEIGEIYTRYYPRRNTIDLKAAQEPVKLLSPGKRWLMGVNNTAHYHITRGTRVLDVGCGDCTSIREINAFGAEGYGIEPDRNIRVLVDALQLKVHIGLFHEIPYPEHFFDFVTMSQVLEHIHDPVELLSSFRRILKDDGKIIIGVPNMDSRLRRQYGARWLNWHVPYHLNHFSRRSLQLLAAKSGYEVVKTLTYTPNLWVDLQIKLANYPVQEGVRVPFFNGEPEPSDLPGHAGGRSIRRNLEDFINRRMGYLRHLKILALRAIDAAGVGESLLVFFEKQKN